MSGHSRKFAPVSMAVAIALALLLGSSLVMAQMPPSTPSERPGPAASRPIVNSVEGKVSKVEAAGKVKVSSGLFGLFGRTLEVTPETQIQVDGKQGGVTELREGDRVKASYEVREGQNIARSIDVLPAEEPRKARPRMEGTPAGGATTLPKTQ